MHLVDYATVTEGGVHGLLRLLVDIPTKTLLLLDDFPAYESHVDAAKQALQITYGSAWQEHQQEMVGAIIAEEDHNVNVGVGMTSFEMKNGVQHTSQQLQQAEMLVTTLARKAYPHSPIACVVYRL